MSRPRHDLVVIPICSPSDRRQWIGETEPETLDLGGQSVTVKLGEMLDEYFNQANRGDRLDMEVRDPVPVVGRAADLSEDRSARKTDSRRYLDFLQMGKDKYQAVGRLAFLLEENARSPASVAIVVIVDKKHHSRAGCSHESAPWYAEVNSEMDEAASPLEIAALQEVAPVFEVAAIGPIDPEARMKIVDKALAFRRFKKRIGSTGKCLRVPATPARRLCVEVYFTE